MTHRYALPTCLLVALAAPLAPNAQPADPPPPPPLLESAPDPELAEPDVVVIERDDERIEEYRMNGQIYMVRIVPAVGPPYYLLDSDGNGSFETTRDELTPNMAVPNWVLFRF
jgi:hypothetical protein